MRSLRSRQRRALCFAAGRAARDVRHRRMHLARTRVRLIPLLYRSACKWARGRPLWRVITPYRYKCRVSCHGGDEPVVVVIVLPLSFSFFLSVPLTPRKTRGLSFLRKIPQRTGCPRVIESSFRGSYSLRWLLPVPFRDLCLSSSPQTPRAANLSRSRDILRRNTKKRRVSLTPPIVPRVLFRIMSFLINIAGFEKSLSPFSICARPTRYNAN